jgi:hypothetical protein
MALNQPFTGHLGFLSSAALSKIRPADQICGKPRAPQAPFNSNLATTMTQSIGILTSGGDTPGLNAAIRGVGKACRSHYDMGRVRYFV